MLSGFRGVALMAGFGFTPLAALAVFLDGLAALALAALDRKALGDMPAAAFPTE
jgi:hypothetical protein